MREDHAAWVGGGPEVDDELGEVDDEDEVDEGLLLVDEMTPVTVVEASDELGAGSTWIGGRSLT